LFELSKLQCDEPPSDFAFNFNMRRYVKASAADKKKNAPRPGMGGSNLRNVPRGKGEARCQNHGAI
jgi:hypothetical protein